MSVYENFDDQKQFACRVIADHARSAAFAIADGILPGNEGRNYVLRKIMRRAIYHGREHLGFQTLFFHKVCDFVIELMKDAYPELETQRDFIGKMVCLEEERFGNTMTAGLKKLNDFVINYLMTEEEFFGWKISNEPIILSEIRDDIEEKENDVSYVSDNETGKVLGANIVRPDGVAFYVPRKYFPLTVETHVKTDIEPKVLASIKGWGKIVDVGVIIKSLVPLYDTFGTPKDLIKVKLEELGISIPEDDFNYIFDEELARIQQESEVGKTQRKSTISPLYQEIADKVEANIFHGYDKTEVEGAKVLALVKNDERVDALDVDDEGLIVLDETPFYAESGGQVGDAGFLISEEQKIKVLDTFAPIAGIVLHKSKVEKGTIKVGDVLTAQVDVFKRDATRRNHTATHLVHAALKEVLGTHVKQAGSVVAPNYLRFDFTHYQPISADEIREIEDLVNRYILQNEPVTTNVMAIEEAMRSGAVALFGEKYGANVRVLSVGGGEFSRELCGGTHVRATGDIGSFKIMSDEAIASGVRRIRAITGFDAFERFREDEKLISEAVNAARAQRDNLPNAIEKLQEELKKTRKEVDELKMKIATGAIGNDSSNGDEAKEINGVKVIAKIVEGLDKGGMRHLSNTLMSKQKSGVVILARTDEDKVSFIVRVSDDLTDKIKAGKIVQEIAPIVGGRGGGKPDMAEGGGTDASKLSDALEAGYKSVEQMLS